MESSDSNDSNYTERKRVRINRRYCPHCEQTVSYKTYKTHTRMYYHSTGSLWHTKQGTSIAYCSPSLKLSSPPSHMDLVSSQSSSADSDESPPNSLPECYNEVLDSSDSSHSLESTASFCGRFSMIY